MADSYCITVQPKQTFRGVLHFQEMDYEASPTLARHAVEQGIAKWNFAKMPMTTVNDWYEETVGYRPQDEDPQLSDDDLRELCRQVAEFDALVAAEEGK